MIAAILKETIVGETRVAATPKTILELIDSGLTVYVESGAGNESCFSDQDYIEAGAQIKEDAKSTLNEANLILKVVPPTLDEIELFPNDTIFISFFLYILVFVSVLYRCCTYLCIVLILIYLVNSIITDTYEILSCTRFDFNHRTFF